MHEDLGTFWNCKKKTLEINQSGCVATEFLKNMCFGDKTEMT